MGLSLRRPLVARGCWGSYSSIPLTILITGFFVSGNYRFCSLVLFGDPKSRFSLITSSISGRRSIFVLKGKGMGGRHARSETLLRDAVMFRKSQLEAARQEFNRIADMLNQNPDRLPSGWKLKLHPAKKAYSTAISKYEQAIRNLDVFLSSDPDKSTLK
jgi:hypothetical protein